MEKTVDKSKKLKNARLCTRCGEIMDVEAGRGDLCTVCKKEVELESIPEPEDIGEQMCWYDHIEVKKHHCKSRKELARRHKEMGKSPQMPQCLVCGTNKKCMPYTCDPDADYIDSAECKRCHQMFKRKSHNKQLCPDCIKLNEKESSERSYKKKFGAKKKCQKNTTTDAEVQTALSIPPVNISQTALSAPASMLSQMNSNTE